MNQFLKAVIFAEKAHRGQTRKYTGEPYITHPLAVAGYIDAIGGTDAMLCAALLHDVVEDCGVTLEELRAQFGKPVANMVDKLTSRKEEGNRAKRKANDRARLLEASNDVKSIKLADLLHNMESICEHDPKFAKVFMDELDLLLGVLKGGDYDLWHEAYVHLMEWRANPAIKTKTKE